MMDKMEQRNTDNGQAHLLPLSCNNCECLNNQALLVVISIPHCCACGTYLAGDGGNVSSMYAVTIIAGLAII